MTITNPYDGTDEVLDANVTGMNIAKSYANGVLTLTGVDLIADYAAALRSCHIRRHGDDALCR